MSWLNDQRYVTELGMKALRCELCGDQVGWQKGEMDPDWVFVRCYACAAVGEAEAITKASA